MKKLFMITLAVLGVVMMSILFTSCSKVDISVGNPEDLDISKYVTVSEYNQIKEDKCNSNITYYVYKDGAENPNENTTIIKHGKILQDGLDRDYLSRTNIFGDTHFGYTMYGRIFDPTTEVRCASAFSNSSRFNSDFSIILGDIIQGYSTPLVNQEMLELYYEGIKNLSTPCFLIEGNHDEEADNIEHEEFTRNGIIEFNNIRFICFAAHFVYSPVPVFPDYPYLDNAGDVSDETFAWLSEAVEDSYNKGYITILVNHYPLCHIAQGVTDGHIRQHADDIIRLCQQYNVKLYLHGHTHRTSLHHCILRNDQVTADATQVMFGLCAWTYNTLEITSDGFTIIEYDTITNEVTHTLYIPMTNQATGTIYK